MTSERQGTSHFSGWATKIASILQQRAGARIELFCQQGMPLRMKNVAINRVSPLNGSYPFFAPLSLLHESPAA
jgi:hypothetical protein